jgi:putative transposase
LRYNNRVAYRTAKINFRLRSRAQMMTYRLARQEAARLWNDLVERHYRIRRANWKWPSKGRFQKWAKGRYPNLHSQSVQQIIGEFIEAVDSACQRRRNGCETAAYPNRKTRFRDVVYTNQGARLRDGRLLLPNGNAGTLRIKIPHAVTLPGRLMEARLGLFSILLVCQVADEARLQEGTIGVDLGVNSIIAATDGHKALVISGRALKSAVRYRNKRLASLNSKQSAHEKGSRRWKRMQRRKAKMLAKNKQRINDMLHKATRKVAREFPNAKAYVGKPFNDAAQKMGRKQAQQVSSACNRRLIQMLNYKLSGAIEIDEAYTSQTCHVCGVRQKAGRIYGCQHCGTKLPRDVNGALNIRSLGLHEQMLSSGRVPQIIRFKYPAKLFAGRCPDTAELARSTREAAPL